MQTIKKIKVKNFTNERGNTIPNQFIIRVKNVSDEQSSFDEVYFQSYDSIIAVKDYKNTVKLDENYWDYSRTTGKYRNQFLNETKKETLEKIKSGEYILTDLN